MKVLDFRVRPRVPFYYQGLVPTPSKEIGRYIKVYHAEPRMSFTSMEESITEMREKGVEKGVIFCGRPVDNEIVATTVRNYPDAYVGLAAARPDMGIRKAIDDLKKAFNEWGLAGLNHSPFLTGVPATDRNNYPIYALCEEMGKVAVIHSSVHYNPGTPLTMGDPLAVDQIAVDFPGLKIVLTHAGIGFGEIAFTVANRHDNVYLDFTAIRPMMMPKSALLMINGPLRKKCIWGTNYPCLDYTALEEWKPVVQPHVAPDFFYNNAARALGIEEANPPVPKEKKAG
ncbi:MAG: amidohydrolase [Deltaproteobacteria bacterium]|nr:amidohydrolase [bacterium]MCB9476269.1 amidohydrolase [Deltaproteobacteria bacterium]MCB9489916.1 amidohydrolase [Deltaproteobacteria bacterium]